MARWENDKAWSHAYRQRANEVFYYLLKHYLNEQEHVKLCKLDLLLSTWWKGSFREFIVTVTELWNSEDHEHLLEI